MSGKHALTQEHHETVVGHLDQLIACANEAKEYFLRKQYEQAAGYLDEARAESKKAEALMYEMWE